MSIHIVQLGSPRLPNEGLRIGTVRRPPRGVPKSEFACRNYFDVWYPELAPSPEVMAPGQAAQHSAETQDWQKFHKAFRKEMASPPASRTLDMLAALSHHTQFSIGCYCAEETLCHRSILRKLLQERGADVRCA